MAIDIDTLVDEMRQLRSEFARIGEALVGNVRRQTSEAASKVRGAAEDTWNGAVDATSGVARTIEDQPLAATAIAFGIGMLLGMLFIGRRR